MSAVIKPRRIKKLPASTPALWLVIGLAVTFFLVRYGQEVLLEHDINSNITRQQAANAALSDETARLEAELKYLQSDKYVEQRARESLNLRRPDVEVLIPVDAGAGAALNAQSTARESPTPAAGQTNGARPNWEGWFNLFAPFTISP
jgi:cell division protein FtsB